MNILNYLFIGEDINKIPEKLKELFRESKPILLKNLLGNDGEVKLIKNQNTYILCVERNYIKEIEIIIRNIENDQLHLTVVTRSPSATFVNTLFQIENSPKLWYENQFTR